MKTIEFKNLECPVCGKKFDTTYFYKEGDESDIELFEQDIEDGLIGCSDPCILELLKADCRELEAMAI